MAPPILPPAIIVDDDQVWLAFANGVIARERPVLLVRDARQTPHLARSTVAGIVLLDLGLAGVEGLEILRQLRTSAPSVPVVVVTAKADARTAVECFRAGCVDYLVKPVAADELAARVRQHAATPEVDVARWARGLLFLPRLKAVGDALVAEALRRTDGNQSAAARILGITQQALSARCRRRATTDL